MKDKEKLNNPIKGWGGLSAISSMVFHTVQWGQVSTWSVYYNRATLPSYTIYMKIIHHDNEV